MRQENFTGLGESIVKIQFISGVFRLKILEGRSHRARRPKSYLDTIRSLGTMFLG